MEDEKLLGIVRVAVREEIKPLEHRVRDIERDQKETTHLMSQQANALITVANAASEASANATKALREIAMSKDENAKMITSALAIHEKKIADDVKVAVQDAVKTTMAPMNERTQIMARELGVPDDDAATPGQLTKAKMSTRAILALSIVTTVGTIAKIILEALGHH